jgi:tetratricopeptide (TPR) repeat protein
LSLIPVSCPKCGASVSADQSSGEFTCSYCHTKSRISSELMETPSASKFFKLADRSFKKGEYGKTLQLVEEGLKFEPDHSALIEMEERASQALNQLSEEYGEDVSKTSEAEQYHLQSKWILNELQANIQVYGSNSVLSGATPADVDLALRYIDRALEHFPDSPVYLNTKALLVAEGKGDKASALKLLEKAHAANPRDITIENNLQGLKSNGCFVATAALGSPHHPTVKILRTWRDEYLLHRLWGKVFVDFYYKVSPDLSKSIEGKPFAKKIIRSVLSVLVFFIRRP